MANLQTVRLNDDANTNLMVNYAKKEFLNMYRGQEIVFTRKCMRLAIGITGKSELFLGDNEQREELSYHKTIIFYGENVHFFCLEDNTEIFLVEFDFSCDSSEISMSLKNKSLPCRFNSGEWGIIKLFLEETRGLDDNSALLKQWIVLLILKVRKKYIDSYKNIIENSNGAVFYGVAPFEVEEFEVCITDAVLVVTNDDTGEKQVIKFSGKNFFCEQEWKCSYETEYLEGNRTITYNRMNVEGNKAFKMWFFSDVPTEKLNISPFTHSLRLSCSIKASAPCEVGLGISNVTNYETFCTSIMIKSSNQWEDILLPLLGNTESTKANYYIRNIIQYVEKNFQKKITVASLAEMVHLHPNYLSRVFKQYMDCSVPQYVNTLRIREAKKLLLETTRTVDSIATEVGFYDSHHLQKAFKLAVGQTPIEYRKSNN